MTTDFTWCGLLFILGFIAMYAIYYEMFDIGKCYHKNYLCNFFNQLEPANATEIVCSAEKRVVWRTAFVISLIITLSIFVLNRQNLSLEKISKSTYYFMIFLVCFVLLYWSKIFDVAHFYNPLCNKFKNKLSGGYYK